MKSPASLFRRTALTVAAGLLVFQLISGAAIFFNLMLPLAHRSADDFAALLVLSARTWVELPPVTRTAFEAELLASHGLDLSEVEPSSGDEVGHHPYINFLRSSLKTRLSTGNIPRVTEQPDGRFHADITMADHVLRFSFSKDLITPRPSLALAWSLAAGLLVTLIISGLLARRITAPILRLTEAARQIGAGKRPPQLPESGEYELADLARIFNHTVAQLAARRENQATLLAGVSHDLRSPLARLKMALGMLAEERTSPLLARMEHDIDEMNALIGAQLELARAQEPETIQLINIDALIDDLIDATQANSLGRIEFRADRQPCQVAVAPLALKRILGNLLNNALRYGGQGGLMIARRRCIDCILIGVRDHGPGIPAELREAVFRPFFRLDPSRNRDTGGSGLGLAIARQLAETQGWRIAIKSRIGGGTSIWLAIPFSGAIKHV
ncbi:cell wall metabolism sensor histidine kinase WalK [Methylotenera sp.]|uniref:sensor histidine kinase n=1 Tax=Methylotenera sp. TaxID=2051956 RepID=UPI0027311A8B|nr:ATP-binding protein [Methylotenera sp.]MDP2229562.1 ATP-binding protein [Methylotenera sp.]MDP3140130.1 ATP-binding protein [Methylotenera sp.]